MPALSSGVSTDDGGWEKNGGSNAPTSGSHRGNGRAATTARPFFFCGYSSAEERKRGGRRWRVACSKA